ncbi:hypothetical protein ARMSODRAFT_14210 [Armillaria solidipes]|uniref:Uncharacterized protein n=1 Tax=Armillaria solidipes TaxID=1076256 RepID=A0A2H3C4B6_9AGAR|nr:hypothetical protein ARMSODRAFT_14210 [Armillaria solidipes]
MRGIQYQSRMMEKAQKQLGRQIAESTWQFVLGVAIFMIHWGVPRCCIQLKKALQNEGTEKSKRFNLQVGIQIRADITIYSNCLLKPHGPPFQDKARKTKPHKIHVSNIAALTTARTTILPKKPKQSKGIREHRNHRAYGVRGSGSHVAENRTMQK